MRCLNCHRDQISTNACPHCGVDLPTLTRDLLPPGHLLKGDGYQIQYALGRSAFGVTYLAQHQGSGTAVAIKEFFPAEMAFRSMGRSTLQIHPDEANTYQTGLQYFRNEGQALVGLHHPHVVAASDFFEENATAYLVMEYLTGQSLKQEMEAAGGKLSQKRVKEIGGQIVEALAALHAQQVYHLNLKPDNVLSEATGIKLIDFRSGRQEGGSTRSRRSFTQKYEPIELMANGEIGPFSDIFELGMMLHELLTGKMPPEVMQRMMNPNWKPEGLPSEWMLLLDLALQVQPLERPQDIQEFWAAVFGTEEDAGVLADPELSASEQTEPVETSAGPAQPVAPLPDVPAVESVKAPAKWRNALGMEFALVQPGTFLMGSPASEKDRNADEIPHRVTLTRAYYLQTTAVTQAQWEAVMGSNPSFFQGEPDLPVESVSWHDCQAFIAKLNALGEGHYRLPTEAEWEYACRAGMDSPFGFGIGDSENLDSSQANFDGDSPYGNAPKGQYRGKTTPVGSFAANAWDFYDMHGNVDEWCQDWLNSYSTEAVTDPTGPAEGVYRVARGGCWRSSARGCRAARRFGSSPEYRGSDLGFRLARSV